MAEREHLLSQFVAWTRDPITSDEKGEAQVFLDRLFQAFGHPGSLDVGLRRAQSSRGSPEMRICEAQETGGTSFAYRGLEAARPSQGAMGAPENAADHEAADGRIVLPG